MVGGIATFRSFVVVEDVVVVKVCCFNLYCYCYCVGIEDCHYYQSTLVSFERIDYHMLTNDNQPFITICWL